MHKSMRGGGGGGASRRGSCRHGEWPVRQRCGWRKYFGMQLTRKLLDGIHQTRRRAIDGVANDGEPIFLSGFQIAPAGLLAKRGEVTQNAIGVRIRKDDV